MFQADLGTYVLGVCCDGFRCWQGFALEVLRIAFKSHSKRIQSVSKEPQSGLEFRSISRSFRGDLAVVGRSARNYESTWRKPAKCIQNESKMHPNRFKISSKALPTRLKVALNSGLDCALRDFYGENCDFQVLSAFVTASTCRKHGDTARFWKLIIQW